jgi:hypothetical protein
MGMLLAFGKRNNDRRTSPVRRPSGGSTHEPISRIKVPVGTGLSGYYGARVVESMNRLPPSPLDVQSS